MAQLKNLFMYSECFTRVFNFVGLRAFNCHVCNKGFYTQEDVYSHIKGVHNSQGSHSDWKTWKTWKNGKAFSSQGKVREF